MIQNALSRASVIEDFDKEAATHLRSQAKRAQQRLYASSGGKKPYDPMRLRARLLRFYKGAITDAQLDTMDYRKFFGYIREADLMTEEENEANNKNSNTLEIQQTFNNLPKTQHYTGNVVPR
jgi:hypothetical protein